MSNESINTMLEKRIAAALADDVARDLVAALIAEIETAIVAADEAAAAEREKALDPLTSPDASKARATMEDAAFWRDRLRSVLPRLKARYEEIYAANYMAQWRDDYEALKVKRDALAVELREVYPDFETKIVDLFARIAANNEELSRLHQARPADVALHLLGAELVARGLGAFTRSEPSITATLKLPTFEPGERLAWPPPQPLGAVSFAPVRLGGDPRLYTGEWWRVKEEEAQAAAERAAGEEGEREAKALENYHGPRWWERARA
jgi:hypothetical protein